MKMILSQRPTISLSFSLISLSVNHLCYLSPVPKLSSVNLRHCVQSQVVVQLC